MKKFIIVAAGLVALVGCGDNAGSNIPIGGNGGNGGTGGDEQVQFCDRFCGEVVCDLTGVDECCPECPECTDCAPLVAEAFDQGFNEGYEEGFAAGQESVECPVCPEPECFVVKRELVCRDRDTRKKCDFDWWNKICEIEKVLVPTECPVEVQ